jgi:hypothetical protein
MEEVTLPKTNLAPALPFEAIRQRLADLGFCPRDIRALAEQTEFPRIPFRSHQLCFLRDYANDILKHPIGTKALAELFEMSERTVRRNLVQGPQAPGPLGRHLALDDESEAGLVTTLLDAFEAGQAKTKKQLLQIVRERHGSKFTRGWVNSFIGRHLDALRTCRSLPQEETRLTVPRSQLEEHIATLKVHLMGKCAELVFNLDELGSADWEDRKVKKVIAPAAVPKEDVFHSVSRRHRHTTLLACISAAGDAMTPMLITSSPIRESLWSRGLRQNEDVMVRHRTPAYIDEELFFGYISDVFIPYVLAVRNRPELESEPAVLLMDSALPHVSARILQKLGENNIIAITFPAHTTNLFQALDLVFFGVLKRLKATAQGEFDDDSVNAQLTKLIQAYEQTATSSTIRGSFRKAGLCLDVTAQPFRIRVEEQTVRENPGFKEVWDRNVSVGDLTRRRQLQRFGIINSDFLPV